MKRLSTHGVLRGLESVLNKNKSKVISEQFQGKFGRLFPNLPAAKHDKDDLKKLAVEMVSPPDIPPTPETQVDNEENAGISAGYTYLGQFIDHDITFDPASSLQKQNDINALIDYRTPKLDLDNIYGRGPDDQPYLYEDDGLKFILGDKIGGNPDDLNTRDLVRSSPTRGAQRAIIGDPRNDENQIVSQLQGMFLRFHNSIVDYQRTQVSNPSFSEIQKLVRWHYQWVVVNDFLRTIIKKEVIEDIFPHLKKGTSIRKDPPVLKIPGILSVAEPFMPVEFSVAAYRFGHSMVRPVYRLNQFKQRSFIFPELVGFNPLPANSAIDWRLFFDFGSSDKTGPKRVQPAYKIDTSLVGPLGNLPPSIASNPSSLAERNLVRGLMLELPSGQEVAKALGATVIPDKDLRIGKATEEGSKGPKKNKSIADLNLATINNNAPLWFYVLAEALHDFNLQTPIKDNHPVRLGGVGGRIVGEVFAWLLLKDNSSFLNAKDDNGNPMDWTPIADFTHMGTFGIADLLRQAMKG